MLGDVQLRSAQGAELWFATGWDEVVPAVLFVALDRRSPAVWLPRTKAGDCLHLRGQLGHFLRHKLIDVVVGGACAGPRTSAISALTASGGRAL